jgi:gliding-associated putative ABC transporter substrate-binding component GldG
MQRNVRREIAVFLLTLAVLVLLGLNAHRFYARIDLTEHGVYTISNVTRSLLGSLPERVSITYYVSPELRRVSNAPLRIEDVLEEYEAYGDDRITVEVVDPSKEGVSEEIEDLGVEPRRVSTIRENEQRYTRVYSGIVLRYMNRSRTIPFIMDTAALEYELTSSIKRLLRNEQRTLTLVSGDEGRSVDSDYRLLRRVLEKHFDLQVLRDGGDAELGDGTDVLVLLGGRDLGRDVLRRIDSFIAGGGAALVLAEGIAVETEEQLEAQPVPDSPFRRMLAHYGVRVKRELVLDEYNREFRIPHSTAGGTAWESLGSYPYWISVRDASAAAAHPVTARFPGLDLLWASPLEIHPQEGVRLTELVHSSTRAWSRSEDLILDPNRRVPQSPQGGRARQRFLLAAALEGSLSPFFPGGSPETGGQETGGISARSGSRVIVVGDTDFASDLLHFSGSGYNTEMILNFCQWLADDEELLQIRTRRSREMRLNALEPAREQAQYRFAQAVNFLLIPAAVLIYAMLRRRRRRRTAGTSGQEGQE